MDANGREGTEKEGKHGKDGTPIGGLFDSIEDSGSPKRQGESMPILAVIVIVVCGYVIRRVAKAEGHI